MELDSPELLIVEISRDLGAKRDWFALIGAYYTTKYLLLGIWKVLEGVKTFILPILWKKPNFPVEYGQWAVVTGATSGIGKGYARQLAKRGMNIVLIGRSPERLERTANEIRTEFHVHTITIQADFMDGDAVARCILKEIEKSKIEIGVLVNNATICYDYPMPVTDVGHERLMEMIQVNVIATTMMTNAILPQMVQRRKGAIINVSSTITQFPQPLLAVQGATKMYIDYFSHALAYEYSCAGITVQVVSPMCVATEDCSYSHWRNDRPGWCSPSPDTYACHALRTLGWSSKTTGYWIHGFNVTITEFFIPRFISMYYVRRRHRNQYHTIVNSDGKQLTEEERFRFKRSDRIMVPVYFKK